MHRARPAVTTPSRGRPHGPRLWAWRVAAPGVAVAAIAAGGCGQMIVDRDSDGFIADQDAGPTLGEMNQREQQQIEDLQSDLAPDPTSEGEPELEPEPGGP